MAANLSYQNDPRWGSFSEEEKANLNKERFKSDWAESISSEALDKVDQALGNSYKWKKQQLEDTRAQQEALNAQQQQYRQQGESRDYQQAQQAYKY